MRGYLYFYLEILTYFRKYKVAEHPCSSAAAKKKSSSKADDDGWGKSLEDEAWESLNN